VLNILEKVVTSRKNRAINLLKTYDVDAWLVISAGNHVNLEYLLGTRVHGTAATLLTRDSLIVLASKLEESMVRKPHVDDIVLFYGSKEFLSGVIDLFSRVPESKMLVNTASPLIAPHASRILYGHAQIIRSLANLYGIDLISSHKYIWELRSVKTNEELEALNQAVKMTLEILDVVIEKIKVGVSEREVAAEIYKEIYLRGIPSFETIVAFGSNSANPHHEISDKKLREGEVGYIDLGIKYASMCADITRAFFTQNVNQEFYKIYDAVRTAQDESIKIIKEGVLAKEPDQSAREVIKSYGYEPKEVFTHGLGHPVGVEVHDVGPVLSFLASPKSILKENMTETVEPAIYLKDRGGIRLEDDIIVKKDHVIRLSKSPEEPPLIR